MLPKQREVEIPLLTALKELGGKAKAKDVYKAVTLKFPGLPDSDLSEELPSGGNKWTNRIQWVRNSLTERNELKSGGHGIWEITPLGLSRLDAVVSLGNNSSEIQQLQIETSNGSAFEETVEDYVQAFKNKLIQKLLDLSPMQFEEFAGYLLRGFGFQNIVISGKSGDGGIDGHGQLRVGMATIKAAFQCKRWQNSVGSEKVQAFRGASQGQFEQGYFFTTSTFTKSAQAESLKAGAIPVILFGGDEIAEIMLDRSIGIKRRPVEIYDDQLESLFDK